MTTATTDNTPAVAEPKKKTLVQLIGDMTPEIGRALPRHLNPERMARIATTALRQTPKLGECTPASFLGALLTSAQLGLEPNTPAGEAYLVPFKNKNRETGRYEMVCTFIPGYRGLVKLARQSNQITEIYSEIVYENDDFDYVMGLDRELRHKRPPLGTPRGKPVGVYAVAKFVNGGRQFEVMTVDEVEAVRARSKAATNGPWVTDWEPMAKKTAFKRLAKWLPLSAELSVAAHLDGSVRTDLGSELVDVQPDYIDGEVDESPTPTSGNRPEPETPQVEAGEQVDDPATETLMAGQDEIDELARIRQEQKHSAASWADFVQNAIGRRVKADKDLTLDEANSIIGVFTEGAAT